MYDMTSRYSEDSRRDPLNANDYSLWFDRNNAPGLSIPFSNWLEIYQTAVFRNHAMQDFKVYFVSVTIHI